MHREKAEKLIRRKVARAKPCPFCGRVPSFDIRCDSKHSAHGQFGHYAIREKCCNVMALGQTELFYCNNWKKPDFRLWWRMTCSLINDWNTRKG